MLIVANNNNYYAECHYAGYCYVECHGALKKVSKGSFSHSF